MELLLDQVPPDEGSKVVVVPIQIDCGPDTFTTGLPITVRGADALETQPVPVAVKVNVAVPADTAVMTPERLICAMALLLLTQVPPEVGVMVVLVPIQIVEGPVKLMVGLALMVTGVVASDKH